ncbi:Conserved oligomeric Golgi complex subunit 3 [Eumeta japonica]|uniref:Conserved oligomeric Golgi complex subunit 3 n=1 Tax=Eumeta variegata TaxID=151549 RepID=A0A4C1TFQ8_EUMVA|nr:Conserved oligomeric Golgi complex subunit 3 [Eumeta japonica]
MTLKEIQYKLLQWENQDIPLAPLTSSQREAILDLESMLCDNAASEEEEQRTTSSDKNVIMPSVDTTFEFLEWYENLCKCDEKVVDTPYEAYYKQLEDRREECVSLMNQFCKGGELGGQYGRKGKGNERLRDSDKNGNGLKLGLKLRLINATLSDLNKLSEEYNLVSTKTNTLHTMSEQLLADQTKLSNIGEDIKQRLHYFTQVEHLSQRLNSPTLSVNSEVFFTILGKIDECLDYMKINGKFKEAHVYQIKYRHLQSRAISLIRSYVIHILNHATEQVLTPIDDYESTDTESIDTAYAVYFGKFQAAAPKLQYVIKEIEKRAETNEDYASLLSDVQREYSTRRARVAGAATSSALTSAAKTHRRDHCSLLRTACSLLAHACRDECALYSHFFSQPSQALEEYLQSLCNVLYETLRPHVIHINHLETLAELCVILRVEILEEQTGNSLVTPLDLRVSMGGGDDLLSEGLHALCPLKCYKKKERVAVVLSALGGAARALLQDVQERLVFRAHVHLRADVLLYRPAPGDLAYPDKLEMMEQIALSIQEQSLKRSDSRNSMVSEISTTSQEVASIISEGARRPQASPADLHGMWYPAVRRTLAALSRLYRCLERRVFQGLAQEAISLCVQSVETAAKQICATKTNIDGELFQIKHLLILREQIAPFQVDFVIKETSLDFSNMKNAAFGLLQRPRQIFSLNSNNALLEFLLEGTPLVREHLLDSRKEVDRQLKNCCEIFIKNATEILVGPLIEFIEKTKTVNPEQLRSEAWAQPEQAARVVQDAQRRVRTHLAPLQRSMQLYLANKETEFILFRPIRNNVVGYFIQMEQILTNSGYSYEDTLIIGCPTPEQMSVFISSASLISHSEPVMPYGKKRRVSNVQNPMISCKEEKSEEKVKESILTSTTN